MARLSLQGLHALAGPRVVLEDVALSLAQGELVGLVGSSGSGKTLTCRSLLGMLDLVPGVMAAELSLEVDGQVLRPYQGLLGSQGASRRARDRAFAAVRGKIVGYLPQDAPAALDPFRRLGRQIEALAPGQPPERWLVAAGFEPEQARRVATSYAHQLSGGMAQRVVVAQALAQRSRFLLADEPTTALDPPLQRRILATLKGLAEEGLGVLVVTHDLGSLSGVASRVLVMDQGRVVEVLEPEDLREGRAVSEAGRQLLAAAARPGGGGGS